MKKLIVIFMMLSAFELPGQVQVGPTYYLDGDSIDINTCFINPLNIDDVNVDKNTKNGVVHLRTKKEIEFVTLDDILNTYTSVKGDAPVVFMIDGKVVIDKMPVRIDRSYFIYVVTKPFKEITYLDQPFKDIILVEITLSTKKIEPKVILRGQESIAK